MAVETTHELYDYFLPLWKKCRDAIEGQDKIQSEGALYLAKLESESDSDYQARKELAGFYDATSRTSEALNGMIFRKEPKIEPNGDDELLKNVNSAGSSIHDLLKKTTKEAIDVSRYGILVDYPMVKLNLTKADTNILNLKPKINLYKAESIINWDTEKINNETVLSFVVICENKSTRNKFKKKTIKQYRVLDLFNGFYRVRIFEKDKNGKDLQVGKDVFPTMKKKKLTFIPFYFYPDIDPIKPLLLGLANLNISHYRTTASYEQGCNLMGKPTMFISGHSPDQGSSIYIGGPTAQALPEPEAKAYYVEMSGDLKALRENLDSKEKNMATLGSRALETQKKQTEATETVSLYRVGENSSLASTSISSSKTVTKALQTFMLWQGKSNWDKHLIKLNTDFIPAGVNPNMITALLQAVQSGRISHEAFFDNLQNAELYKDNITFEDEQARIDNQPLPTPEN